MIAEELSQPQAGRGEGRKKTFLELEGESDKSSLL